MSVGDLVRVYYPNAANNWLGCSANTCQKSPCPGQPTTGSIDLTVAHIILYRWNHLLHLLATYNGWVNSIHVDVYREIVST